MPEELKPCPACGSRNVIEVIINKDDKHIMCRSCYRRTSQKRSTWRLARKLWNREAEICQKN